MGLRLRRIGYYVSPPGGAPSPFRIRPGELYLEGLTGGRVQDPVEDTMRGPGWMFVHRAGEDTVFQAPLERRYECVTVSFAVLDPEAVPDWPRGFYWESLESFAQEILYALHHQGVSRPILGDMIRAQANFRWAQERQRTPRDRIPRRIRSLLDYIDGNLDADLTMPRLAARMGLSVPHLHACFREAVGHTPRQYILEQRMRAARHRLVTTTDPIKQIAAELGYANPENFCRMFKRSTGSTAATFRRRHMRYQ